MRRTLMGLPLVHLTATIAVLLTLPFLLRTEPALSFDFFLLLILATLAVSWNLVGGYAGQINLGHAVFFGLGAFASGFLIKNGLSPIIALPVGGLVGAGMGVAMVPLFRLRGDYFAIGTLGLAEAVREAISNYNVYGVTLAPSGLGLTVFVYLALILAIGSFLLVHWLIGTKFGYAVRALRDSEVAASSLGIMSAKYKLQAVVISGMLAGLAGALFGFQFLYVQPADVFGIKWTIEPLFMVFIGGQATTIGPIVGAVLYQFAQTFLRQNAALAEFSLLIFGAVIVLVITFLPRGILGVLKPLIVGVPSGGPSPPLRPRESFARTPASSFNSEDRLPSL